MGSNPDLKPFAGMLSSPDLNIFYEAPVLIIICATENDRFVEQDCCLAAQNLMLAARAKGLGTCWIGFAEAWLNRPEAKKELGIPATFLPIAPVILGYPRAQPEAPERHRPDMIWIGP
jgi:nitroreductase